MRFVKILLAVIVGVLLAIGLLFGLLIGILSWLGRPSLPHVPEQAVLYLPLSGPLWEHRPEDPLLGLASGLEGALTLWSLRHIVEVAASDRRIQAVWVQLGDLQADWARLTEARRLLERLRRAGKYVIAYSGPDGFSEAAYYVATAADSLFGPPEGFFEWDGLYAQTFFFKGTLDRLGIQVETIRAGAYKGAVEPFTRRNLSTENRQQLSALLNVFDEVLLEEVSRNRRVARDSLLLWRNTARIRSTAQAHALGLLDGLAYKEELEALLRRRLGLSEGRRLPLVEASQYARLPNPERKGPEAVAVVYATGTLVSGESGVDPLSGEATLGSESFLRTLHRIGEDRTVKAVLLRIDSPGGSAPACDVMWHAIRELGRKKPIVASLSGVAASGGYYLAVGADTIVADPTSITGSIGVFGLRVNAAPFLEQKLGITTDTVKTAPYADWNSGLRPLRAEERRWIEAEIERIYGTFLRRVSAGRGRSVEEIAPLAGGRVWSGRDAYRLGLVDTLGGFDVALQMLCRRAGLDPERVRLKPYPTPRSLLEHVLERLSARFRLPFHSLQSGWRAYQDLQKESWLWAWWPFRLQVR